MMPSSSRAMYAARSGSEGGVLAEYLLERRRFARRRVYDGIEVLEQEEPAYDGG